MPKIPPDTIPTDEYLSSQNLPQMGLNHEIGQAIAAAIALDKLPANRLCCMITKKDRSMDDTINISCERHSYPA
jgi:hypothetical protein